MLIYIYTHSLSHTQTYVHIQVHTSTQTHICIHTTHVNTHAYTLYTYHIHSYTHIHMAYTYICTHSHTCKYALQNNLGFSFFLFMCLGVFLACAGCPRRSEEHIALLGAGATQVSEPLFRCLELCLIKNSRCSSC